MLVYRKEVATVSQPPFPTVPPAGLPTTSTVGAKAIVRASVDKRVVSEEEGAEGGEMCGGDGVRSRRLLLGVTPPTRHTHPTHTNEEREREMKNGDTASHVRGWAKA